MGLSERQLVRTVDGIVTLADLEKALYDITSTPYFIDCSTPEGRQKAYEKCDVVRTVLGRSSSAIGNLKIHASDPQTGKKIDTPESRKVIAQLNKLNKEENFTEFYIKLDLFNRLHGTCYVNIKSTPFGEQYVIIPFQYVTPEYEMSTDFLFDRKVSRYNISTGVESYYLKPSEVFLFNDGILSSEGYSTFGASRLESLSESISCYVVIMEVLTELYGSGGARNLISLGAKDHAALTSAVTKQEKDSLYTRLKKKFGFRRDQDKDIVLSGDAKVYPLTAKIVDMGIPDTVKQCIKSIYGAFEIPAELASVETSRFKTLPEARKEAYTQAAIPKMKYYMDRSLTMIGKENVPFSIEVDFSHLDFYQEAKKEAAVAFAQVAQVVPALVTAGVWDAQRANEELENIK